MQWFCDQLFFDIRNDYKDWAGSLHLVAPNPVYRSLSRRLKYAADGAESSTIHFVTRRGRTLDGLRLDVTQYGGPVGVTSTMSAPLVGRHIEVPHVGTVESVAHRVLCSRRGLLEWAPPQPYVGTIQFNVGTSATSMTVVPPDPTTPAGKPYTQLLIDSTTSFAVGHRPPPTAMRAIQQAERARQSREESERRVEKWFHGDQDEAIEFVRNLLRQARQRVLIVDPYFATNELFSFARAVAIRDIPVTILTSGEWLKKDPLAPGTQRGATLRRQLAQLREHGDFHMSVMTGKPVIHDRFLIVDADAWLSGNSLNHIGERAGMIVKLVHPLPIINRLTALLESERVTNANDWHPDGSTQEDDA